jgi:hypothetical protein
MNDIFKIPPQSPVQLTDLQSLANIFLALVGKQFQLTGKSRTDGSKIRKLIAVILESHKLPVPALKNEWEVVPPKGKGVPKIVLEFVDTYIVTTGSSYNLQVWNRLPSSNSLLIKYDSGESLRCKDVRFIFVRVDPFSNKISTVVVATPEYIERKFGKFGKSTIKHQLLISKKARISIYNKPDKIIWFPDSGNLRYYVTHDYHPPKKDMLEEPDIKTLYSIQLLKKMVAEKLIGKRLPSAATKNRGQALERMVLQLLQYYFDEKGLLHGGFPDIKNQLLEVKIQDSPTVDLGRYSPATEEIIIEDNRLTTNDVRYLIALTNPQTEIIEGVILAPGEKLGELFSYVSAQSYKCQRSIPMTFFDKYNGQSVFNPD